MSQLITVILSSFLQVLAFTLIPFICFFFRKDKTRSFFQYIGLVKTSSKAIGLALVASILFLGTGVGLVFFDDNIKKLLLSANTVSGHLHSMGLSSFSIIALLFTALVKTSLSEEIFFRGLIGKQLISKFGFKVGNTLQSAVFGLIHLLLFWSLTKASFSFLIFILLFSFLAAWLIGYIKEKHGNGSIIPGWIAHGIGNTISYYLIAFVV
jgi:membrane protease YdiL (CAAX protease family)